MIVPGVEQHIISAAKLLQAGGLVAFPTETVYGLGADALNEQAVNRIYQIKGRPAFNPLIVHLRAFEQIAKIADLSNANIRNKLALLANLWPGPLSVVLPKLEKLPAIVCGGHTSVAIRIPNHPVALRLLEEFGGPIAAPSANRSNYISPTLAEHVEQDLGTEIGFVLDGGPCPIGIESTVISLLEEVPIVLRPGAISMREIEALIGPVHLKEAKAADSSAKLAGESGGILEEPQSPGMLSVHYAPTTRLAWKGSISPLEYPERVGLISFSTQELEHDSFEYAALQTLSPSGETDEIAAGLYAALRALDQMNLDLILIDPAGMRDMESALANSGSGGADFMKLSSSHAGLGLAILDRLNRATAKFDKGEYRGYKKGKA